MTRQSNDVSPGQGVESQIESTPPGDSISEIRFSLIALGFLRATEAIAWTSIFPYVYPMIQSFPSVKETDIPFYAGLMIAVFTFCEFLSGMLWAKLSDRIGRKSTLLIGSACAMATSLTLGMSRSLALAIASRAFGGLSNPNVGLVQTCVVELARRKEQRANALSFATFLRSMGNLIGPVIGGFLADPAVLYPSLFPSNSVWTTYRFLLPNIAVAFLQASSFAVAFLVLPETHPYLSDRPDLGLRTKQAIVGLFQRSRSRDTGEDAPLLGDRISVPPETTEGNANRWDGSTQESHDMPPAEEKVFTPQIILQIISVSILAFHKVSSDAIIPTFLEAPPMGPGSQLDEHGPLRTPGGFGYSNQKVGSILLSQAIVGLVTQTTLVPVFINKLGPLRAYRIVLGLYPFTYIFTPLLPTLPPNVSLICLALDLWTKVILSSIGYVCSAILIANVTPTRDLLARVNGASASFSCLLRSIGPAVTGKLLAVGLERGYAAIAFWSLGIVALFGMLESTVLKEHL